jgi:eukaryotic-like serine/threonine-protein kinase
VVPEPELNDGLADRFRVERELGRGGMATVYLAQDLKQDRYVAVKIIHPHVAASLGTERFLREVKLTAKLRHPHILPLFDSGDTAGQLWYTMPFVEGESLRQRLTREGRLPVDQAVEITEDILAALTYAHQQGIVHRDIKPENILLEGAEAVLADFGIAQAISAAGTERLTGTGVAIGTLTYMSPEQAAADGRIDGRSDLYSLGCVLYEMIAGQPPFTGSPQSVVAQHLSVAPPPLAAGGAVPEPLARVVEKALSKSPEERFPDATAFASALAASRQRIQPRRKGAGLVIGAAVLGLLGLTFYAGRRIHPDNRSSGSVASGLNRRLTQLTFSEGLEEWPTWSPDGTRLAYVAEAGGFRHLFVRTLASGAERRITDQTRDDIQPTWSADGKRLAFVRANTNAGRLEPNDINGEYSEGGDIWTVDLETRRETRLVADGFNPAFSPVAGRLAFDAGWGGARRIWIADSTGRNPRQVTSDSSEAVVHSGPRWSPDGQKLAFRREDKIKSDIVSLNLGSGLMTRVTDDNVLDMNPVWAPDGAHLYFASSRGGGLNLWRINLTPAGLPSGSPEQLTTGAGDDIEPTISPAGDRLAFAVRGINSDLWRLPVSPETGQPTGAPVPLVLTTRVESRGAWSPDGKSIAFNSDRLGEMNIWVRTLADSADRQLTHGSGGDYQPSWSPDGRTIAFFSARSGNADIWTVTADGGMRQLTDNPGTDTNPFYAPDGKRIAFISDRDGRAEIWVMNADGSDPRRVTSIGAGGHFLRWTPDGSAIVFRGEAGTQIRIYRVSLTNGALTSLPDVASGAHMSFSPSRALILDVKGHKALWVFPVDGRPARQIFAFTNPDIRIDYPSWSPDGRAVLFDRAAPKGGDLWLLEAGR